MTRLAALEARIDRRALMQMGAMAGLGAALMPRLAYAASEPTLLPQVRDFVSRWVGPGKLPGMVAMLGLPGRETEYVVRGSEGFLDPDAVTPDTLYRIYSMTKPITGMATMMLIDEGKLGLDQPLYDIIPKFREMQVQVTPDGSVTDLVPAKRAITVRQLLTHTSGLGYTIIQKGPIKALMEDRGLVPGRVTKLKIAEIFRAQARGNLANFADGMAEIPLVYQPGTKWSYGVGLDILGRVIEVVSGMPFETFLQERMFGPAGMTSTWFTVPKSEGDRLTTNYAVVAERLVPIDGGKDSIFLEKPAFPAGGAGLVSSPRDYDRFLRMLAGYGKIESERVMGELAVRVGTSNLLPEGVGQPSLMGPKSDFGAGGRVGVGPEAGIYGWAGAAGTVGMVDMRHGLRSGIFVQFMPPDALEVLPEFQTALQADVMALLEKTA